MRCEVPPVRFVSRRGVSIAELTIAVMIVGILAAVAAPRYSGSLLAYRTEVSAARIAQDIELTQRTARQSNSPRSITFSQQEHSYSISGQSSIDHTSQPYRVALELPPYQSSFLLLATFDQPTVELKTVAVQFDRFGVPDQGIVLVVGKNSHSKRIRVEPTSGRVIVE